MDACSSQMFSFSGCDDYLTFSFHLDCQKGNFKELKQKVLYSEYDYEKKSFYSGYTLLQAAAVHDRLYVFQWIFDCSSSSYYGLAYFGSIAGHGRAILESMKYCEGINLNILHYIATTCSPSSLHEECASLFLACLDDNLIGVIDCFKEGFQTTTVDDFCHTALHLACLNENLGVVKYLFERFYDKDCLNILRNTPFRHLAKCLVNERGCNILIENINDHTPLHIACQYGNIVVVKYLIDVVKVDALFQDSRGNTLLHHASHAMGDIEVVEYLVDVLHCDPFYPNNEKSTPIHLACRNGNLEVAKYLSSATYHYRISCVDKKGRTPLHEACIHGHLNIVSHLTHENHSMHEDIYCSDYDGFTPLHLACKLGHLNVVMYMINECKCDVSYTDDDMHTPLHLACQNGHIDIVKYLIDYTECNSTSVDKNGLTPCHIACSHKYLDIAVCLINKLKCDTHIDQSLLHIVCQYGDVALVQDLINGLEKNEECIPHPTLQDALLKMDSSGNTPLHYASQSCQYDIVQYLVSIIYSKILCQDFPNSTPLANAAQNDNGNTPLHIACLYGHVDDVKSSIDNFNFNPFLCKNNMGLTPLHFACVGGNFDVIKCLVTDEIPSPIDDKGYTPLHYASQFSSLKVVQYLISKNVFGFLYRGLDNNTAFHLAIIYDRVLVVKYFLENNLCERNLIGENGKTPLLLAAFYQSYETLKYLVDDFTKCDHSISDDNGKTAFYYIYDQEREDIMNYYVNSSNYKITGKSCKGKALLYAAAERGQFIAFKHICQSMIDNPNLVIQERLAYETDDMGNTALHLACTFGCLEVVKYLVNEIKLNLNILNLDDQTCFHLASGHGYIAIVEFLINYSTANIILPDKKGQTPLIIACQYGHLNVYKYLFTKLDSGVASGKEGYDSLYIACRYGSLDIVKYLVEELNIGPLCKDRQGLTPFHHACAGGFLELVRYLNSATLLGITDDKGYTSLHHASQYGNLEVVQYLVSQRPYELMISSHDNNTPLHLATKHNKISIVMYFLDNNLYDCNLRGENGKTPLILAAFYQSYETLKYLIGNYMKCDHSITDDNGKTALCYIYDQDRQDIINYCVDSSNDEINGRKHKDKALLYAAAKKGQFIGFKHICQSMANLVNEMQDKLLHETDDKGNTALHLACIYGHLEVVQYLASEIKLNLDILNLDGQTCFHLASKHGQFLIMQYLSSINANISCKNENGSTPLHIACQHGYLNIVELLSTTDSESVLDAFGRNPLHIASYYGQLQIVQSYVNNFDIDSFCKDPLGLTPLHYACIGGNLKVVQFLDTDIIPATDNTGYTPLHHACKHGNLNIVQYITLKDQSQLFCQDHNNNTPLHIAARYNQTEVVQSFLEHNLYDGNIRGESGKTPLILAAFYRSYETLKLLIGEYSQYDHSITDDDGKTALCYIYDQDIEDIIHYYVDSSNYDINGRTHKDKALLYAAAEKGQFIGFKHICKAMANNLVNVMQDILSHVTDTKGNTAQHLACTFGHLEVVQYLASEIKLNLNILNVDDQTCIHLASEHGQFLVMQYLSSINANVSCKNGNGSTPLHIACQHGYLNIVELLSTPDSESVLDAFGRNPLHIASYYGHLQIVQSYVNNFDIDSFCKDPLGLTPLHYACIGGYLKVVQFLDTDIIPATDNTGYTPLHHACKHGNLNIVQYITLKDQSLLFCPDHNINTPLHIAALYNQTEVVQYFLEHNLYDCNIIGENGKTPFLIAAEYRCNETLDYLFHTSLNCDPGIEDSSGKSGFLYLYQNHRSDIVGKILSNSSYNECNVYETDVFLYLASEQKQHQSFKHILQTFSKKTNEIYKKTDAFGNTALHIASQYGCLETVQYILDKINFPSNHQNFYNQTCLHLSSQYGQLSIVNYLTEYNKCDPLTVDSNGCTPLHYAAITGHLSVIKYFIEEVKLSPEVRDANENTPLHLASTNGHKDSVDYLVTNSSKIVVCNIHGNTPLHLACRDGHYEVFRMLLTTTKYDIHARNKLGISIADYAKDKPDMAQTIRGVYGVEATFIPKIFVIGFSGAGKSTLVSALQKEESFLGRYLSIPKVQPHTVGVIPVKFQSSSYGTVNLYDFAGHEEYHANHQLLFQSSYLPIVLLLVNLRMEEDDIISSIKYWVNILKNSLTSHTGIKQSATVILLASHYDQVRGSKQEKICNLEVKMEKSLSKLKSEDIEYNRGLICLDCRKPSCHGIERLRTLIKSSCLACRAKLAKQFPFETSLICQEILNFLSNNVSFKLACTISDICEMARKERFIPGIVKSDEEMFEMCRTLGFYGKIVLLTDSIHQEESWIILDEKYILSEFHRSMHLLQSKSEQSFSDQVAFGLVSISQLHQLFPNNLDLILKYLQYSQICAEIEAESFSIIPQSLLKEHYYFFPYLTKENKPELFTLKSAEEMTPFYCWQLVCHDPFTPRFLQVLLVQLTVPVPGAGDVVPPHYTVWKNGIHIRNNDTTESMIEVNNSASQLLFAIRCQKNNESSLLTRRSHLIDLILSVLTKNCPLITYEEFLFQPQNFYPIKSSAKKISLKKAAGVVIEGRPTVFTYDGSHCLELAAVLCSDPVLHLNPILLKRIYLYSNDVIPPPTMEKLCMQGNIMSTWNSSDEITYKQLQDRLSCYSVFLRRNIWVSCDVVVININTYMSFHVLGYC